MKKKAKTNTPSLPQVSPQDMWVLLGSTVRYSLGRTTYMSGLAGELVLQYQSYLTTFQLSQISSEVLDTVKRHRSTGKGCGADMDLKAWEKFLDKLYDVIATRRREDVER